MCDERIDIYENLAADCLRAYCSLPYGHSGQHEYVGQSNPDGDDSREYVIRWT